MLSHPSISGPTDVLTTIAAGGVASFLALLALTVDETDEAFANIYSTAMSIQNFAPRAPQRVLIVGCSVTATIGALAFDLTQYSRFLYLLGAFFVPLFGVLLADWIQRGMHYTRADVFEGPAVRPGMIFAWLCGFLFYEWLATSTGATADLGFWTSFLDRLHPLDSQIGASLPSFALSFALASLVGALRPTRRRRDGRRLRMDGRDGRGRETSRSTGSPGAPPRIGGGPYHAARAIRLLAARAELLRPLRRSGPPLPAAAPGGAVGVPLRVVAGERTAAFSFEYDGDRPHDERRRDRRRVDSAATRAWSTGAFAGCRSCRSLRSDFPTETLARACARTGACCSTGTGSCGDPRRGRCNSTRTSTATCSGTSPCSSSPRRRPSSSATSTCRSS